MAEKTPIPAHAPATPLMTELERRPMYDYDRWFVVFIVLSFLAHTLFVVSVKRVDVTKIKDKTIDEVPQRIARLLMDKPKKIEKKKTAGPAQAVKAEAEKRAAAAAEGSMMNGWSMLSR